MIKELVDIFRDSSGSFEGQEADENVILLLRRHPFFIILRLAVFGLIALVPIIVGLLFLSQIRSYGFFDLFLALSCVWYLFVWLGIFYSLTLYTLNVVIITNKRIVENEQYGLFNRKISELSHARVQDVTVKISGIIETFLHFGDITVQTAAAERQFIFHQIPQAAAVKDEIMRITEEHHDRNRAI